MREKGKFTIIIMVLVVLTCFTSCVSVASAVISSVKAQKEQKEQVIEAENTAYENITGVKIYKKDGTLVNENKDVFLEKCSEYLSNYNAESDVFNEERYSNVQRIMKSIEKAYEDKANDDSVLEDSLNKLKDAYSSEQYAEIDSLYDSFSRECEKYKEKHDVGVAGWYMREADDVKEKTFRATHPWKETEKYNELVNAVDKWWVDLPVYIANENTGLSMREILAYHDFRDQEIYVTQGSIYIQLEIIYSCSMNYMMGGEVKENVADYKFEIVKNGDKLLIQHVYSGSDNVYSASASDIKRCFDEAFISRSGLKEAMIGLGIYDIMGNSDSLVAEGKGFGFNFPLYD